MRLSTGLAPSNNIRVVTRRWPHLHGLVKTGTVATKSTGGTTEKFSFLCCAFCAFWGFCPHIQCPVMNLKLATALVITVGCFARPASIAAQAAQAPQTSQAPQTPPPVWTGSVGAGLALTSGNTETKNINLSM